VTDISIWQHDPAKANGAALLNEVETAGKTYVVFSSEHDRVAWVLFHAATHAQPAWEHATRLVYTSPLRRCGKTRAQDVGAELGWNGQASVNISVAALVRSIDEQDPPTLHLDEYDTVFGKTTREGAEDLRGILNAGFARGKPYRRWNVQTREQEVCPSFCMATLAGIGDLPDTIEDRSIVLHMRRRAKHEVVRPYRIRRDRPGLVALHDRLHTWVNGNIEKLRTAEPVMPVEDRDADKWEPLIAVADLAGGDWPRRARAACLTLCAPTDADDATLGERLLCELLPAYRDLLTRARTIYGWDVDWVPSQWLVDELVKLDDAPWGDIRGKALDQRLMARLLRPYGVKPLTRRLGQATPRCYERVTLHDAWVRYCGMEDPTHQTETAKTSETSTQNPSSGPFQSPNGPSTT
jgi:hypothetical protein